MSASQFVRGALIAKGSCGSVWMARAADGQRAVMKVLSHAAVPSDLANQMSAAEFEHPHVVTVHGNFEDSVGASCVVMEYMQRGSLQLKVDNKKMTDKEVKSVCVQVLRALERALEYLHARRIVHRDIKPGNILVAAEGHGVVFVKVSDFGLIRHLDQGDSCFETAVGSASYLAPEVLLRNVELGEEDDGEEDAAETDMTVKVDVWSLAVTLYQLATGDVPWPTRDPTAMLQAMREHSFADVQENSDASPELAAIIRWMMTVSPRQRPSVQEVMQSQEFKTMEEEVREPLQQLIEQSTPQPAGRQQVSQQQALQPPLQGQPLAQPQQGQAVPEQQGVPTAPEQQGQLAAEQHPNAPHAEEDHQGVSSVQAFGRQLRRGDGLGEDGGGSMGGSKRQKVG